MRFVVVTSFLTLILVFFTSAISVAILSWCYSESLVSKKFPEPKIEIKWGEGS
jgi:hypothetical protein